MTRREAVDTAITVGLWVLSVLILGGVAFAYGELRGWWS